jgi:outer membrane biosynthesis protein TonB
MSITSALITSTIDKIKKDLYQLEDWLNSLHSVHAPAYAPVHAYTSETDVSSLLKRVEELTIEVSAQKHTIHHLVDRIDVMEETREIHIDGHLDDQMEDDPWLSGQTPLQNEIVDPTFFIHKTEEVEPPVVQHAPAVEAAPIVETKAVEAEEEEPQEEEEAQEPQEEEPQEVEEAQEEEKAVEEAAEEVVEKAVEEAAEEEAVEEEEEEGVELEEITVKGVNYYKDPEEGFIYEIDSEGQPSENPIGVWKTKTQTISFYRST